MSTKKKKILPAVLFQRNLGTPRAARIPAKLELFEAELARVTGGLIDAGGTISYAGGVPSDCIDC